VIEPHRIWIEQCEAARGIRDGFGTEKALGYLIGEKLLNFIRAASSNPDFASELPNFIAEIRIVFEKCDIRDYFENLRRVGIFGHVGSENDIEELRAAGAIHEDPVSGAEDVILVERMKKLLLSS
jgi:hypothetical protein